MMLIGMFDSPFVRRVAISMQLLQLPFEHANWSVGRDFDRIRQYNPLGRVPTLVLDDGEALLESSAILDYLDEQAGAERALLPQSGSQRRDALRLMAMATGAAEKGVLQVYERAFRPPEKWHQPWLDRCATQVQGALNELEHACMARGVGEWLLDTRMSQADITLACAFTFLTDATSLNPAPYPAVQALAARCEALSVFQNTRLAFFTPGT
ncbi:MAG: glutathione S-transferase family protein [Steroidobacteraceae bacterium]